MKKSMRENLAESAHYMIFDVSSFESDFIEDLEKVDFTIWGSVLALSKILSPDWEDFLMGLPQTKEHIQQKKLVIHRVGTRSLFRLIRFMSYGFAGIDAIELAEIIKAHKLLPADIFHRNTKKLKNLVSEENIEKICSQLWIDKKILWISTMSKRTKIIATVWPATASEEMLTALSENGVNVVRFNFSHADHESARDIAHRIHTLNASGKTSLSLLLDTKWPELRTGDVWEKKFFQEWEIFRIYTVDTHQQDEKYLSCDYSFLVEDVVVWGIIEIDSGLFHVRVILKWDNFVEVRAENDAVIGSHRHVNLPWVRIRLPWILEKDKEDILFGIQEGFDFIAASFIRTAENIREIREFLDHHGGKNIKIIAKIENREWIDNLEEIMKLADGIMVARGDLGIEIPIEQVPKYQDRIVDLARKNGKFIIVATHMLESMIEHPFPTRAEVSDIFRAVLHGVDATMLSWETTTGKYPIESVIMMRKVIEEAEQDMAYEHYDYESSGLTTRDIEKKYLIRHALKLADELQIENVLVFTKWWTLARLGAAYRPNVSVHAFSPHSSTLGYMRILFWVNPHVLTSWGDHADNLENALRYLIGKWCIHRDMRIIAVTDVVKNGKEIPVMEIITVHDVVS